MKHICFVREKSNAILARIWYYYTLYITLSELNQNIQNIPHPVGNIYCLKRRAVKL